MAKQTQVPSATNQKVQPCLPVPKPRSINEYVRESQMLLWIWKIISEISCFDYEQYLRDGVILCQLIQALSSVGQQNGHQSSAQFTAGDDKKTKKANIEKFISSCRAYGLPEEELFEVEDLLSMQDIPRVTRCLYSLGKLAAQKFGKPELGQPYDEWLEQQLSNDDDAIRRSGMPQGDDLYVSHVDITWVKDKLEKRQGADMVAIHKPPREPLVQRTSSKPLSELRAIFMVPQTTVTPNNSIDTNPPIVESQV